MDNQPKELLDCRGKLLPPCVCEICGYKFDAATEAHHSDVRPDVGDFAVCIGCGEITVFDENMYRVTPTIKQMNDCSDATMTLLTRAQQYAREKRYLSIKNEKS